MGMPHLEVDGSQGRTALLPHKQREMKQSSLFVLVSLARPTSAFVAVLAMYLCYQFKTTSSSRLFSLFCQSCGLLQLFPVRTIPLAICAAQEVVASNWKTGGVGMVFFLFIAPLCVIFLLVVAVFLLVVPARARLCVLVI
jgi:hypothetical protein